LLQVVGKHDRMTVTYASLQSGMPNWKGPGNRLDFIASVSPRRKVARRQSARLLGGERGERGEQIAGFPPSCRKTSVFRQLVGKHRVLLQVVGKHTSQLQSRWKTRNSAVSYDLRNRCRFLVVDVF
jgi:hypothetical protein